MSVLSNRDTEPLGDTGKFKISVRQEGYQSSGFTRGTVIDDFHLVGKGPLSATELVDDVLWTIIKQVSHDYTDPSNVLTSEFADPMPVKQPEQTGVATTATESTYNSYQADTEINIHFFQYDRVTIYKDGCGYGELKVWDSPSKESVREVTEIIDNEAKRKRKGLRLKDYRRNKPLYRPPVDGIKFHPMGEEEKNRFVDAHEGDFEIKALTLTEAVDNMSDWELEILTSESDSEIVYPSISWRYTGEIIHQCGIPSESPGFTITAIPKLEEFMIETKSFSISDLEVDEYDLPIKWNTGSGRSSKESTTDSRRNQYYSEWESKMFIESESELAEVVKFIINNFTEHISSKSYEQITELAYGIGSKNSSNLQAEFPQLQDLLDASKQELEEVHGIGDESGDNLYEIIQNRRLD